MKLRRIIIPFIAVVLLAACNQSGGNGKKVSSSTPKTPTYQPVPTFDDLPDYGGYEGTPGIAPSHIQSISIDPNKEIYSRVGDILNVKGSVTKAFNDDESIITYSLNTSTLASVTSDNKNAVVKCLGAGTCELTAKSFEGRYIRKLIIHILPNDGSNDLYETSLSLDKEKQKFGWVSSSVYPNGKRNGISQFGHLSWAWKRSKPGVVSSYGGAIAFGKGGNEGNNEGNIEFKTWLNKPVKNIVFGISSTANDEDTSYSKSGSSLLTASLNGTELDRIINGKTYQAGTECYSPRGTEDETVSSVEINCNGQSGEFKFNIGESSGYIRLKYIVVNYDEFAPSGTLSEAMLSFDDQSFKNGLTSSYKSIYVSDSNNLVDITLSKVKLGNETSQDHPLIDRNSTIVIKPKNANLTISKVEFVNGGSFNSENSVENKITITESYTNGTFMRSYGVETLNEISLERLSLGCDYVQITNTGVSAGVSLAISSLKITLTDGYEKAEIDHIEFVGPADVMNYSEGDVFDPTGASVNLHFSGNLYAPIQINDLVSWPTLHEGETSVSGTSDYGTVLVEGISVGPYVDKVWEKANSVAEGTYLVVSKDSRTLLDASSSTSEIQSGTSNRNISSYFENDLIHGDYQLDHSYINLISASGGNFKVMNSSKSHYFNGVTSGGKISFSTSSSKNHSLSLVDGELTLSFTSSSVTYTLVLTASNYFSFVDLSSNSSSVLERVEFYRVQSK